MSEQLYDKLEETAKAHLLSLRPQEAGSNKLDREAFELHIVSSWRVNWGHDYFVSTKPPMQGDKSADEFSTHMSMMCALLRTWTIDIKDVCVDARRRSAILRANMLMSPTNGDSVVNDILFWIYMDETGDKVVRTTEYVDGVASEELARRMGGGAAK